jgi:two-component system, sensor histidine kinase and response regulator
LLPVPVGSNLKVLLAEDNPINQKLVARMLEKRGHRATLVTNGKLALEESNQKRFDVILMDIQMPEMDGLETTAAIRAREKQTGGRIPIIALTANALAGDRERCLAAGMDGYLSKPIQAEELWRVIEEYSPRAFVPPVAEPGRSWRNLVLDEAVLLKQYGEDRTLLREIIAMFAEESGRRISEIRSAVNQGDGATVIRLAHSLKGALGYLGARQAQRMALELETASRTNDPAALAMALAALESAVAHLVPALEKYCPSSGPNPLTMRKVPLSVHDQSSPGKESS